MVYSGGVRSFVQAAAVIALALSALPSVRGTATVSVSCQSSEGNKKFGIQAISDEACSTGGLGCYNKHCRYCKVLDTDQSKHFDTCLSHGVAFTTTTPVVVTHEPCHVSSGDVAVGISAATDSSCLSGGLGCYNDHCRYCRTVKTPQSAGFMPCSKLDRSYNARSQAAAVTATASPTNAPSTNAPTSTVTDAPTTTETPTQAPTSAVTDAPIVTEAPTEAPTSAVTDTQVPTSTAPTTTETPTEAPSSAVTGAPMTTEPPTQAPTSAVTDAPTMTEAPTEAPTSAVVDTQGPTSTAPTTIETPTEAPSSAVTDAPISTEAPTDTPTSTNSTTIAPTEAPTSAVTDTPATEPPVQDTCSIIPSVGDLENGVNIVTDPLCESKGFGCLSNVCRFCKVKTTPQSDPYMDCALINATASVLVEPTATVIPDATIETPSVTTDDTTVPGITTDVPTETPASNPATEVPAETPATSNTSTNTPTETPPTSDGGTDAPTETPATSDGSTDASTETPGSSDISTDAPTETPASSDISPDAPTETPGSSDDSTDMLTETPGSTTSDGSTDASTETPGSSDISTDAPKETPGSSDISTDAPTETPGSSDDSTDMLTEAPGSTDSSTGTKTETPGSSDTSTDTPTETPGSSDTITDTPTETPDSSDGSTDALTDSPGSTDTSSEAPTETPATSDAATEVPSTSTADVPVTLSEAPVSPTTCTLVASAEDNELGISVATDSSCKSGGEGCIDKICRFCKVTTTIKSAPYVDCASLQGGSSNPGLDAIVAPTDAVSDSPAPTTGTPIIETDAPTEAPASDDQTETPATTEIPTSTVETDAPTTEPEQPTCGLVATAGDIAVGVHIATDVTCSFGGIGCINDLCRFCNVETTAQSETFVNCSSLAGFTPKSATPVPSDPVTVSAAPVLPCELVASTGDASVGIRIVTDSTCSTGGNGCISDVCRFCKVITSIQSAAFIDCVTVVGYTPETEAPTSDVTTIPPSPEGTCNQIASEGDLSVGVGIATDASCRAGGVGCIDDLCRFCQISATVQSADFVSCSALPGYTPRTEAPVDTATTSPTSDTPILQAACDLVVSAGDAAVGISITGDATCAAGGLGCIDSVCRFCKVTTTVQSAAYVDCTSVPGFKLATIAPVDTTTPSVDSTTTTLDPTVFCGIIASEGDVTVGINITADASCRFGGVGCINSVCRFCKVKTTEQSAAFVDCPAAVTSSPVATPTPVDVSVDSSDVTSTASSLPDDVLETPIDTTATNIPHTTSSNSTTSGSDEGNSNAEAPTNAPNSTPDASDRTDITDNDSSEGSEDTTRSTDATEVPEDDHRTVTESPKGPGVTDTTATEAPTNAPTVDDDNDTLTETPKAPTDTTTTKAPTKTPTVNVDDIDWEGSESAEVDSASTYDDSDGPLGGA